MPSLTSLFPPDWLCDITIKRDGTRNNDGDPVPGTTFQVPDCLVGTLTTNDPTDRSDQPETELMIYGPVGMDVKSTDTLIVPASHLMKGSYRVDGDISWLPLGTQVPVRRV